MMTTIITDSDELRAFKRKRKLRILLCYSGSVATVKVPELAVALAEIASVRLVGSSKAADHFLGRAKGYNPEMWAKFNQIGGEKLIIRENMEWDLWNSVGDPVVHIELSKWADIIVLAPASADIMAKASMGICDSLLLCIWRAFIGKPCLICPAMNTAMWEHGATTRSIELLQSFGCSFVEPVTKELACKVVGKGAMAPIEQITAVVKMQMGNMELAEDDDVAKRTSTFIENLKNNSTETSPPIISVETEPNASWYPFAIGIVVGSLTAMLISSAVRQYRR